MKLGSNDISSVKIGSTDVNKIYIGSTEVWSSFTGLLDTYSGAAAAYSLRQLKSGVTNAIRVRRASDNAESDIGFVSGQLDTSTLETFCSGTDGFVTTWYDQSGNGNNATQTTASAQPQIVSSGSTILENGKPSLSFDGTQGLQMSQLTASTASNWSVYAVIKQTRIFNYSNILWAENVARILTGTNNTWKDLTVNGQIRIENIEITNLNQYLLTNVNSTVNINSISQTDLGASTGALPTTTSIGYRSDPGSQFLEGNLQEMIIYLSDESTNSSGIESNINNHYNIY